MLLSAATCELDIALAVAAGIKLKLVSVNDDISSVVTVCKSVVLIPALIILNLVKSNEMETKTEKKQQRLPIKLPSSEIVDELNGV